MDEGEVGRLCLRLMVNIVMAKMKYNIVGNENEIEIETEIENENENENANDNEIISG